MKDMNKIYDLVINNQILSTEILYECGLSLIDIKRLIDDGKLRKNKDGIYEFYDFKKMFSYGKYLIHIRDIDKANNCFLKCLENNPKDSGAAFYLFTIKIHAQQFEEAFKYLDILYNCRDQKRNNDVNLYIYLMSYIIKLPDKYTFIIENLLDNDIEYNGYSVDSTIINDIRSLILRKKFSLALTKLGNYLRDKGIIHTGDLLVKKMLSKIIEIGYSSKDELRELIKNKEYDSVIKLLDSKPNLQIFESYIYRLSSAYIEISKNKIIPFKNSKYTFDLGQAIESNNFSLALQLIKDPNSLFLPVLVDLVNIINEILKENIIVSLNNQNLDEAFNLIKQYLININRVEHEQLVIKLIKLSLIDGNNFNDIKIILDSFEKNGDVYISYYINKYNTSLINNKINQAQIYLEIISILDPKNDILKWNLDLINRLKLNYLMFEKTNDLNKKNESTITEDSKKYTINKI